MFLRIYGHVSKSGVNSGETCLQQSDLEPEWVGKPSEASSKAQKGCSSGSITMNFDAITPELLEKLLGAAYKDRMRRTASSADSRDPNAVRRKYPSPLGPNPEPGVPTTCTVSSSRSKNCHDDMPSGTASHR